MRKAALAALLFACAACAACAGQPAPPPAVPGAVQPAAAPPRVLVTIVVDQFAGWLAEERWPELPKSGGFARLLREGTWVKRMRYAHAVTDTAPGHSSLYTGVPPWKSGIYANEQLDAQGGRVSFLRDEATHVVTEKGEGSGAGSSLARLRVDTLADRLHKERPDAVVLSFSLKDRGALFAAGRTPRAAIWLDPKQDRFVTSTAIARALPAWALPVASADALARVQAEAWTPLDPAWLSAHVRTPDAQPGEGDERGFGVVFPHTPAAAREPGYGLRASPFGDDVLFALALAGIDGEKVRGKEALVALSLSANDYIGHVFGPDSWEAFDELLRLDRALGAFLSALDARLGPDGYAVLLTADHGVTGMPEAASVPGVRHWCGAGGAGGGAAAAGGGAGASGGAAATVATAPPAATAATSGADPWQRACGQVGRIMPDDLLPELREAARRTIGPGDWISGVLDPYVFLTKEARALPPRTLALLDRAVSDTLRAHPEVAEVTPTRTLPAACPPETDDSIAALVCRSVAPGAGDYYVVPAPGSFFDPNVVVGKGTSHGTPYLFYRTVPLVARAPGVVAAGNVIEAPAGYESFIRTAAALLGIAPPADASAGLDLAAAAAPRAPSQSTR